MSTEYEQQGNRATALPDASLKSGISASGNEKWWRSMTIGRLLSTTRDLLVYALVPIFFFGGGLVISGFTRPASARALLVLASFLGIACIGQTLTIVAGGIDLSIPAVIGMADAMMAQLYGRGMPFVWVVVLIALAALAVGVLNGVLAYVLRTHTLIITLAMSSIVLGAVLVVTHGNTGGQVPAWLSQADSPMGKTGPIPLPTIVVIWIVLAAFILVFQRKNVAGRWIYAMGANPLAARLALVRPLIVWIVVFVISALSASLAGILLAGFSGGADINVGSPYLFTTIAAVVVGGTSLMGGRGGYGRSIAGALLITEITTLLIGFGASDEMQQMMLGVLIVAMVALYGRQVHVSEEV